MFLAISEINICLIRVHYTLQAHTGVDDLVGIKGSNKDHICMIYK